MQCQYEIIQFDAIVSIWFYNTKARRRPSDAIELNWTVQSRLLVCGGLQLVCDDREMFLKRFKFRIAVQSRLLVCAVLQLARNTLFIGDMYSQSNCPVVSRYIE